VLRYLIVQSLNQTTTVVGRGFEPLFAFRKENRPKPLDEPTINSILQIYKSFLNLPKLFSLNNLEFYTFLMINLQIYKIFL